MCIFRRYLVRFDTTPVELHLKQRSYSDTTATIRDECWKKYAPKNLVFEKCTYVSLLPRLIHLWVGSQKRCNALPRILLRKCLMFLFIRGWVRFLRLYEFLRARLSSKTHGGRLQICTMHTLAQNINSTNLFYLPFLLSLVAFVEFEGFDYYRWSNFCSI